MDSKSKNMLMLIKYITLTCHFLCPSTSYLGSYVLAFKILMILIQKQFKIFKISKFKNLRALPPIFSNFSLKKFVFSQLASQLGSYVLALKILMIVQYFQNIFKILKFKNLRALPPIYSSFSLKKFVFSQLASQLATYWPSRY